MTTNINADDGVVSGIAGLKTSADNSGVLALQTNGTTALTVNASQALGVGSTPSFGTAGQVLTSGGSSASPTWTTVGGGSAATPTALGTVYGKTDTGSITFLGYQAGNASSSAAHNVAVGASAMAAITTGSRNIILGSYAAGALTTGEGNIVLGTFGVGSGTNTFSANTSGSNNIAIGGESLNSNTTVNNNIAVGYRALSANTTGTPNLAVGISALQANTTGSNNTAFGDNTLRSNTTASNNTAVGYQAGYANTTGSITAVGYLSLDANTTGYSNAALGADALGVNTTGYENTALGAGAGASVVTGARNVYVGYKAGSHDSGTHTGVQSIFLGAYARPNAAGDQAEIVLGYDIIGKGTDTTFIRNACYQGNNSSSWSTTSDQRLKKNIADNNDGLDKINLIRVRNFEYRLPDEITELDSKNAIGKEGVQLGVIAQELQAVLPECVKQESSGVLSVDTDNLTWYLINAVKQLKAEFDAYKASHP